MLNRYEHEDAEPLVESVRETLPAMRRLLTRARHRGVLLIYVNDNYEDWTAARDDLCERALAGPHRSLVEPVLPPPEAAFLTKARHSVFYETQLDYLLRRAQIKQIVLAGQVTEQCILYSALDAYVRHYAVAVPHDAVAHIHPDLADAALRMMEINMKAHIATAASLFGGATAGSKSAKRLGNEGSAEMAKDHGSSVQNDKQYEGLRKKGMSKERAAKIANSEGSSKRGGKSSGGGAKRNTKSQGGTKAQKSAAGRKGGKSSS